MEASLGVWAAVGCGNGRVNVGGNGRVNVGGNVGVNGRVNVGGNVGVNGRGNVGGDVGVNGRGNVGGNVGGALCLTAGGPAASPTVRPNSDRRSGACS